MSLANKMWKLMVLSIVLNFSTGFVFLLPGFGQALNGNVMGATYNSDYDDGWKDVNAEGVNVGEDQSSTSSSFTNIPGWAAAKGLVKFFLTIDNFMFGFINLLSNMLKGFLDSGGTLLGTLIFSSVKSLILLGYTIAAFKLWTNKNVEGT